MDSKTLATIQTYNRTAKQYSKNVANLHPAEACNTFLKYLPAKGKVLDLGCGSGRDTAIFVNQDYKVTAIDLSSKLLDIAKANEPKAKYLEMDMRKLEFNNEFFDGIWAIASLLHLPKKDIPLCLNECNRVLKKQGTIFVAIKQGEGEEYKSDLRYDQEAIKFYSYFNQQEMTEYLNNSGFEIINTEIKKSSSSYLQHPELYFLARKLG